MVTPSPRGHAELQHATVPEMSPSCSAPWLGTGRPGLPGRSRESGAPVVPVPRQGPCPPGRPPALSTTRALGPHPAPFGHRLSTRRERGNPLSDPPGWATGHRRGGRCGGPRGHTQPPLLPAVPRAAGAHGQPEPRPSRGPGGAAREEPEGQRGSCRRDRAGTGTGIGIGIGAGTANPRPAPPPPAGPGGARSASPAASLPGAGGGGGGPGTERRDGAGGATTGAGPEGAGGGGTAAGGRERERAAPGSGSIGQRQHRAPAGPGASARAEPGSGSTGSTGTGDGSPVGAPGGAAPGSASSGHRQPRSAGIGRREAPVTGWTGVGAAALGGAGPVRGHSVSPG